MKKTVIAVAMALGILLFVKCPSSAYALTSREVMQAVNSERQRAGLPQLVVNKKLETASHMKLVDMQKYSYWSHDNPVTQEKWWKFVAETGFHGLTGENLSRNFNSSGEVIHAWMNSPLHRKNVLEKGYTEVGISIGEVVFSGKSETVVVMEFIGSQQNIVQKAIEKLGINGNQKTT